MCCPPGSHYYLGVVKGWGRGCTHPHLGSAQARTVCLTHSGTSPHSGETGAQAVKHPMPALGEPLGSHCLPQPVVSGGWRSGTQLQGWTLELCLHPRPSLSPLLSTSSGFFLDLLHSTPLPSLTSGQNPCIWFSVTIILVMITKTEVPLGEEWREKYAKYLSRQGYCYPHSTKRQLGFRLRDLAKVTWLIEGRGGVQSRLFQPPA